MAVVLIHGWVLFQPNETIDELKGFNNVLLVTHLPSVVKQRLFYPLASTGSILIGS